MVAIIVVLFLKVAKNYSVLEWQPLGFLVHFFLEEFWAVVVFLWAHCPVDFGGCTISETLQDSFWIIICSSRILIISGSRHQSSSSTGQAAWTCHWLCVFGQDQTHGLKGTDYRQWQFWNMFAKNLKVIEMSGSLVYLFTLL